LQRPSGGSGNIRIVERDIYQFLEHQSQTKEKDMQLPRCMS
jgi:hypothetical protein